MDIWELASVLAKSLIYISMLAITGGLLVLWMTRHWQDASVSLARRYLLPAAFLGLLACCQLFLIQIGYINQSGIAGMFDPVIGSILVETEIGTALRWRLAGFLLALVALLPVNLPGYPFQYRPAQRFSAAFGAAALICFCVAVSSQGHAAAVSITAQWLAGIHLLAIGCWAGALYPLYLLLSREQRLIDCVSVLERFGIYGWWILGLMLLSGISLIWLLRGGVFNLGADLHGQLLLAKLGLVAGMMALGALHKFRWVPRLRQSCAASAGMEESSLLIQQTTALRHALMRSIRLETLLAVLVLLLTASLTTITGPV